MSHTSIVFFAEDPGAVNFVGPVAAHLGQIEVRVLSAGSATGLLRNYGIEPTEVGNDSEAVAFLKGSQASCVVVGTSENLDSPAFALVQAARSLGCPSVGLVDFAANAAHRFRGHTSDPLAYAPDWLLVPDEWTASEYLALGFPRRQMRVVGHPQYDAALRAKEQFDAIGKAALKERLLPQAGERPVVVFVSEVSTGLEPTQYRRSKDYSLTGRGDADERTEIVLQEVLDAFAAIAAESGEQPYLTLRRHPKEPDSHLHAYLHGFDFVSGGGSPLELIYIADLVIGMSSLLLMEAFLMQVPVLSVLPRSCERDWLPITRTGVVPCVTERADLHAELRRFLQRHSGPSLASAGDDNNSSDAVSNIISFLRDDLAIAAT